MERKAYPSDLTDAQWRLIAPLIPDAKPGGRPRKYEMREVIDGLLYLVREGCSWRGPPHDLPHWKTCYNFLRQFEADGTWVDFPTDGGRRVKDLSRSLVLGW
jgi:transposase